MDEVDRIVIDTLRYHWSSMMRAVSGHFLCRKALTHDWIFGQLWLDRANTTNPSKSMDTERQDVQRIVLRVDAVDPSFIEV